MTKDVLIAIRGTQHTDGEEPQVIELTTDGTLTAEDGVLTVSYRESEMTGLDGVITTFRVENDRVILQRDGDLNSTMTFIEGEKTESLYDMGFGLWGHAAGGVVPAGPQRSDRKGRQPVCGLRRGD